jgi:glutamyl-tRNA synthetase
MARFRFAPSPTGNLHIGSVRTAIFNWVWSQKVGGRLILRIEDTDVQRSKPAFEANIREGLDWLGIHFDESPWQPSGDTRYRQSERIAQGVYAPIVHQLIHRGDAYYCFETDDELAQERSEAEAAGRAYMYSRRSLAYTPQEVSQRLKDGQAHTIRFKVPHHQHVGWTDTVRGAIRFDTSLLSDPIIMKSDGQPTYNFAVVVDDYDMGITHVVRGEDHISNTAIQLLMYQALGWDVPVFAHLPIILGPDRSKLSKRHGAQSVSDYRDQGFVPEAIINYLSLLGWTPPNGREKLSQTDLVDLFDPNTIHKAGAIFDTVKLTWMNKQYLAGYSEDAFMDAVWPFIAPETQQDPYCRQKVLTIRDNLDRLDQVTTHLAVYELTTDACMERVAALPLGDTDYRVLTAAQGIMTGLNEWTNTVVATMIDTLMNTLSLGKGAVMKPLRKGLTGFESGPNLADCLALIPLAELRGRLSRVLAQGGVDAAD